ncbi:dienelactone hydrolase family protein [Bradyrhizobium sp.]|uniref:dienelactone hydrolase family protein n=1 Tax=Bradyrhizobium sp. TaxID=376 RepID=UPI003C32389A
MLLKALLIAAGLAALPCVAGEIDGAPQIVPLESALESNPNPVQLQGALRRPEGSGPFGAVVLLHGCNGNYLRVDARWGRMIAAWGYVTLSVDSLGTRNIADTCNQPWPFDMGFDAYRGLKFLAERFDVDPKRVAVLGFSSGARMALWSVERNSIEHLFADRFRSAIAFDPGCNAFAGHMTVPTLILIGEREDRTRVQDCRDMVAGRSSLGITRDGTATRGVKLLVYPDADHAFDVPRFQPGKQLPGHWPDDDGQATGDATQELHSFLDETIGRR